MMSDLRRLLTLIESREEIDEMPISTKLVGDTLSGTFRQDDITLATNPKAQAKLAKVWHSSLIDVDLYLINKPGGERERRELEDLSNSEVGQIRPAAATKRFGTDIVPNKNNMTIVFTHNEGNERVPLTGWIIAHRIAHLFLDAGSNGTLLGKRGYDVGKVIWTLVHMYSKLMRVADEAYTADCERPGFATRAGPHVLSLIGTTKATRDKNLSGPSEIMPEAFAQYLLTGKVQFNDAPERFSINSTYMNMTRGRYETEAVNYAVDSKSAHENLNAMIQAMAGGYQDVFAAIIKFARGKVFYL